MTCIMRFCILKYALSHCTVCKRVFGQKGYFCGSTVFVLLLFEETRVTFSLLKESKTILKLSFWKPDQHPEYDPPTDSSFGRSVTRLLSEVGTMPLLVSSFPKGLLPKGKQREFFIERDVNIFSKPVPLLFKYTLYV